MRPAPYLLFSTVVLTGCAVSPGTGGGDAEPGRDTGTDASHPRDAGHDATHRDSGTDATVDAPRDAGREASHDAGHDAGRDASHDVGADATKDGSVDARADVVVDAPPLRDVNVVPTDAAIADPCALPGSVLFTSAGRVTVDGGGASVAELAFLTLPTGFCAHYFGAVPDARQIRFAPGGELFVASPSAQTTGGNPTGALNAIVILPDDDKDGVADTTLTFLSFTPGMTMGTTTQGMLFTPGFFYFQDGTPPGTRILRIPYVAGERETSATAQQVADINVYTSSLHWPKTLDMADDGTIYVGNGGDQGETCDPAHPFHGGILSIDPAPGGPNPNGVEVAKGLRNPIAVRCRQGNDTCFALELAKDYTSGTGGREKMIPIHQGDDWGFPCCATTNLPYQGTPNGTDCSTVTSDTNSFMIGDTPFGVDFAPASWPAAWAGHAYVVTHGQAGMWQGARMVAIPVNAATGLPTPSTDTDGGDEGMVDFATGWDDGSLTHGRPAAVAFAPDGRLFVANDYNGVIFWIAPITGP
jgi:glucose/arabinose dehydrogenase